MHRQLACACCLAAIVSLPLAAVVSAPVRRQQQKPQVARYGDLTFDVRFGTATLDGSRSDRLVVTLNGENGAVVPITTPPYQMAARRIVATLSRFGKPPRYKATNVTASGSVRIVAKDAAAQRETVITCDRAVYTATTAPTDRGKIDLTGNVRTVTTDPGLPKPLTFNGRTGTITFLPNGGYRVDLEQGQITGAINEPAPKPQTPSAGAGATPPKENP